MNAKEYKAQKKAENIVKYGRWASDRKQDAPSKMKLNFEAAPQNEIEVDQHARALFATGYYPPDTTECFNVGIAGGCCPGCFVYKKGECEEPDEMIPQLLPDEMDAHIKLYGGEK